ncbi:hypothetical protein J4460_00455 [Candidatus Woesearchaeota archaeon]|nr:MAG: hypothetical protein QS99_C0002G0098 [archaeon GW2011_AR4]MBS3129121.1 hypothetical protein [Candidatus Woesearchaeota archaeon]HIH37853.1 hypothetical protein [Candidatus Woesearchaeota archaeon]HIH49250.1 hypothetical protein [Candidatus Woesearchaeota archaeon]HIJ03978.1 hypothetical protein [Candidatus Woesearchaeota archaeon]
MYLQDESHKSNLQVDQEQGRVMVSINPQMYPLDVIYSAAYSFTNKNYVLIDGEKDIEVIVEIKPMASSGDLEALGREFNNTLLRHQIYNQKSKENAPIRQVLLYRALLTNSPPSPEDITIEDTIGNPASPLPPSRKG